MMGAMCDAPYALRAACYKHGGLNLIRRGRRFAAAKASAIAQRARSPGLRMRYFRG